MALQFLEAPFLLLLLFFLNYINININNDNDDNDNNNGGIAAHCCGIFGCTNLPVWPVGVVVVA